MINRTHSSLAAFALAAFTLIAASDIVHAQGVPWGACPNTLICNRTNCTIILSLWTIPRGLFPVTTVPPGACIPVPTPGIAQIIDVQSAAGIWYPVLPPPPIPPCNCPPATWSVCCVTLPTAPPGGCCCDICFDNTVVPCTITINPAACLPPCRP
ncbi:MAG TPA: hypothetical protein VHI13_10790 [Candidatus Kapabacteria bacterium]|nr:hypothetical protein [Candidatus Kapabacteria bacterium]